MHTASCPGDDSSDGVMLEKKSRLVNDYKDRLHDLRERAIADRQQDQEEMALTVSCTRKIEPPLISCAMPLTSLRMAKVASKQVA